MPMNATVSYEQTHGKKGSIAIELPVMENNYNFVVEDNAAGISMDMSYSKLLYLW